MQEKAVELAELLSSNSADKGRIELLRQHIRSVNGVDQPIKKQKADIVNGSVKTIGIFNSKENEMGLSFERDARYQAEFDLWADIESIPPKGNKFRIVYLGESVARGYFFDPNYTPAKVLEQLLQQHAPQDIEVVDLARTSLTTRLLAEILQNVTLLKPDAVVFFGGNNWATEIKNFVSESDLVELSKAFDSDHKWKSLEVTLASTAEKMVKGILSSFNKLTGAKIPVYFVVPEFNLRDWKSNERDQIISWPVDQSDLCEKRKWLNSLDHNEINFDTAAILQEITTQYPHHPRAFELLGEYFLKNKKVKEARACFEAARDTAIYRLNFSPRCLHNIRQTVLQAAEHDFFYVVDLPQLLHEHHPDSVPGREMFIDYCHLSENGITFAVSQLVKNILHKSFTIDLSVDVLLKNCPKPDAEVSSGAHFLAAIHNAHLGQPIHIVQYHLDEAVRYDHRITPLIQDFALTISRNVPRYLTREFRSLADRSMFKKYLPKMYGMIRTLDYPLIEAILNTSDDPATVQLKSKIHMHWKKYYSVESQSIDLAQKAFQPAVHVSAASIDPVFKSLDIYSEFVFVSFSERDLHGKITCRLPYKTGATKDFTIFINGNKMKSFLITDCWTDIEMTFSGDHLQQGVNVLRVDWPYIDKEEVPDNRSLEYMNKFLNPVFSEIHSFVISESTPI